jgi:hypothetical protein
VAVLGAQCRNRDPQLLGSGGEQLATHLSADDPDRVPQRTGVVRTTGDLCRTALLLGRRTDDVHALHGHVEVVSHLHGKGRQKALADVLAGALGVDPVIGLDLNLQVVHRRRFGGHEDVREVLLVRKFIGLRRESRGAVSKSEAGGDRQCWPGDQESLQDLATSNRSLQSGHSGAPSSCGLASGLVAPVAVGRDTYKVHWQLQAGRMAQHSFGLTFCWSACHFSGSRAGRKCAQFRPPG